MRLTQTTLEQYFDVSLLRGWILAGAGPARYGYGLITPCKMVWLGPTLARAACALFSRTRVVDPDRAAAGEGWHDVVSLLSLRQAEKK